MRTRVDQDGLVTAGMDSLDAKRLTTLKRRLEASAIIALLSVGGFFAFDYLWGEPAPLLVLVRATQIALSLATWSFVRRVRTWRAVADGTLLFIAYLTMTAVVTAILRGEGQSLPVLITMIVLITSTFTEWGLRRQLVLSAITFGGLVVNLGALGALGASFPYPLLPITVALGVSVWVAAETDRHGRARHAAEVALRESEERFRMLAEHAPVPIWMSDTDGALTYLNPAWGDLVAPGASLSRTFWRAVHTKDRETFLESARQALVARRPFEGECRVTAPDGSARWLTVRGVPRFAASGAFEGHIGTAVDVTESKAEARDLAAAHMAALEAGRLKSSFLATMSHEIRTPMHGIFGMTELALDTRNDAERTEFIRRARSCAKTLMTLLDEILDLSRIEAGRLELVHESVDLDEVLENAVDTVAMAATEKGLGLFVDVAPGTPTSVGGDADRLRQILTNLLANAVKFTDAGAVELRADVADGALRFSVRDTGVGIPPDACQSIFDPFTQADRDVGARYGGTGLGLAISNRLASAMGGRISVASTVGVGTTFEVTLPLRSPVGPTHGRRFLGLENTRILIADAAPERRQAMRRLLEAYGAGVRTVATTAEADVVLGQMPAGGDATIHAVIVDVDLEADTGNSMASGVRAAATRSGLDVVLVVPLRAGCWSDSQDPGCHVVTRPILPATLLRTLLGIRGPLADTGS